MLWQYPPQVPVKIALPRITALGSATYMSAGVLSLHAASDTSAIRSTMRVSDACVLTAAIDPLIDVPL